MVGWTTYHMVPDPSFHPYRDAAHAMAHLSTEAAKALREHLDSGDGAACEHDLMFVNTEGACMGHDWNRGDLAENLPMDPSDWKQAFLKALAKDHGAWNRIWTRVS